MQHPRKPVAISDAFSLLLNQAVNSASLGKKGCLTQQPGNNLSDASYNYEYSFKKAAVKATASLKTVVEQHLNFHKSFP